jgi:hypothetical protein
MIKTRMTLVALCTVSAAALGAGPSLADTTQSVADGPEGTSKTEVNGVLSDWKYDGSAKFASLSEFWLRTDKDGTHVKVDASYYRAAHLCDRRFTGEFFTTDLPDPTWLTLRADKSFSGPGSAS